jgi:Sec-independent protein translocase protein TatA
MNTKLAKSVLLTFGLAAMPVNAQDLASEIGELRQLLTTVQADYDARISDLEERLARAERQARSAQRDADEAIELAEQTAIDQSAGTSAPNTFNPAIGAILVGGYADVDNGWEQLPGFQPAGEIGAGDSGFTIGEAEINLKASVDAKYFGNITVAVADEDGEAEIEFEEAWLQTTDLPLGLSVIGGRFFSEAGYLNGFHFHADDFADRPLPYQAFFGGRYTADGLQARWIAPTSLLVEFGGEINWGGGFPATANGNNAPGAWTLFSNFGGDIGDSHSWQLGLSWIRADAVDRAAEDDPAAFTGNSDLAIADFVWKWAPGGNPVRQSFKLQGEYFVRSEKGLFAGLPYDGDQNGWYLQGVWQFVPRWRIGLRHDVVDADNNTAIFPGSPLATDGSSSRRDSLMLDWSPSEFSRLRMQYTNDQVLTESDNQWFLQYIMSIGAHGAHQF